MVTLSELLGKGTTLAGAENIGFNVPILPAP
jgi:hypothetical protein